MGTISFIGSAPDPVTGLTVVTLRSDGALTPWGLQDLKTTNAVLSNRVEAEPGKAWTFELTPITTGSFGVTIDPGLIAAADDSPLRLPPPLVRHLSPPTATITGPQILDGCYEILVHWSVPVPLPAPTAWECDGLRVIGQTVRDPVTWKLDVQTPAVPGEVALCLPDGATVSAAGHANAPVRWMAYALSPPAESISPVLERVVAEPDGTFTAVWGYFNRNERGVACIPIGPKNQLIPGPDDQGQPREFLPGRHVAVFKTPFAGGNLVWSLRSPYGARKTATASAP